MMWEISRSLADLYFPRARVLRDLGDLGDLGDLESSLDVSGVGIWRISGLGQITYLGSVGDLE